ncbi:MAG: hypothetical protein PHC62_03065 [Candidatus Izemoplasmatales bacterium]|nr:hypothetical protein [Candidatus Izemoplasmatales bacterium]
MQKKRVYICFDYDNDKDIKGSLVAQSKLKDSPFEIVDMSIKEAIDEKWKATARARIKSCDLVIVLCGRHTSSAVGVSAELTITQEELVQYFLLCGKKDGKVEKPLNAKKTDVIYPWSWTKLKLLINKARN